jgi:hypothetical protein
VALEVGIACTNDMRIGVSKGLMSRQTCFVAALGQDELVTLIIVHCRRKYDILLFNNCPKLD